MTKIWTCLLTLLFFAGFLAAETVAPEVNILPSSGNRNELDTPTIGRTMPTEIRLAKIKRRTRWASQAATVCFPKSCRSLPRTVASTDEPSESSAYIGLNIPTACPPRAAVPVNPRARFSGTVSFQRARFAFGQGCDCRDYEELRIGRRWVQVNAMRGQ